MILDNDDDLQGILRIGRICGLTLKYMLDRAEPGMTTAQLDAVGAEFLAQHHAQSAPMLAYQFPGYTCISLNDEAAHGIPGARVIQPGDVLNIDVSAELDGYWADTASTMIIPPAQPAHERLCQFTQRALNAALDVARAGQQINMIGQTVENIARRGGYSVIRDLPGHGIGRHIHEKPSVFNFYKKRDRTPLYEGQVLTIEPFFSMGNGNIYIDDDQWTLKAVDDTVSAQYEHTIIITPDRPILATAV